VPLRVKRLGRRLAEENRSLQWNGSVPLVVAPTPARAATQPVCGGSPWDAHTAARTFARRLRPPPPPPHRRGNIRSVGSRAILYPPVDAGLNQSRTAPNTHPGWEFPPTPPKSGLPGRHSVTRAALGTDGA